MKTFWKFQSRYFNVMRYVHFQAQDTFCDKKCGHSVTCTVHTSNKAKVGRQFFRFIFIYMYACICVSVYVTYMQVLTGQERASYPWESQLQAVVSSLLRTELESSTEQQVLSNYRVISPAQEISFWSMFCFKAKFIFIFCTSTK